MRRLLILILLFTTGIAHSQTGRYKIPEYWNGLSFRLFADSLDHLYQVKIYFKQQWINGLIIKISESSNSLADVMTNSLQGSGLFYSISDNGNVLLTRTDPHLMQLPGSFFDFTQKYSFEPHDTLQKVEEESSSVPSAKGNNILIDVGTVAGSKKSKDAILSGVIREQTSGEPVIGATLYDEDSKTGTQSNSSGNYFLKLSTGVHHLSIRCLGKKDVSISVNLHSDGMLNITMEGKVTELKAVTITAEKYRNIESAQMGFNRIDVKSITKIPTIGEADMLKVSLLLPGVQSVGEGTTGFNVRGGNADQNLILLDNAPVFNPSHLMGFFSAFNSDLIREFELFKSTVPAKMGGRLSSVLDLTSKDGNKNKYSGIAGISPLTGKFEFEGPIIRDKLSFIVTGRSTYSGWLLKQINNEKIKNSQASFYDMSGKLNYELNKNNTLSLSAYMSHDDFSLHGNDTTYNYSNKLANLEWKHKFSPRLLLSGNLIYSSYEYSLIIKPEEVNAFKMNYNIGYYELRGDFTYFLNNNHLVNFGMTNVYYNLLPGERLALNRQSLVQDKALENEKALDVALYLSDEYKVNDRLMLSVGMRYSMFNYMGPKHVFEYQTGLPYDLGTLKDTISYSRYQLIKTYSGLEPRISLRYILSGNLSIKLGYSRMRQNIHIMSNTFSISPVDIWKLSDKNLKPQIADQFSLGLYRNFNGGIIETSVEAYYKIIQGLKDYKAGAVLLMNEHIETEIIECSGKAYGVEVMVKRSMGKLNGWFSYTYSRIFERSNSDYAEEKINGNNWFPAIYDKPHSFTFVGNYKFSRRFSISSDIVYSTGRPVTYPVARFTFGNATYLDYSNRNEFRIPDYFRWDFSVNLDGNLKVTQRIHNFWSLSVYNLTSRENVYSVYFTTKGVYTQGYRMSIFAVPIITLTYNIRF